MASRWLVNNRDSTPLSFGELVSLARSGELQHDDLVKAEWDADWRPAHTVVGLFYRAKRTESPVTPEPELVSQINIHGAETSFCIDELEAAQKLQAAEDAHPDSEASWQRRLREVQEARTPDVSSAKPSSSATNSMQLLFEAAMAPAKVSRWTQGWERWQARKAELQDWLNSTAALRLVIGLVFVSLVGWWLVHDARQAALRFPREDMPDRFVVPVIGDCSPGEFLFVLADLVIVSMFLIYFGGLALERWLESRSRWSQEA